ncbi:cysteine-rich 2-binding -like [Brachionus plicatilis]|uniref:Cysteine-rich 2-binding-like n=1 Tax=Brachionus plicatilis TaxID=10195 RepID=A0A3M7RAE1_BRAPC|nr:cysteine-rich 2-binding -like [Brachionus plicatilis]
MLRSIGTSPFTLYISFLLEIPHYISFRGQPERLRSDTVPVSKYRFLVKETHFVEYEDLKNLDLENFQIDPTSQPLIKTQSSMSITDILNKVSNCKTDRTKIRKIELSKDKIDLERKKVLSSLIDSAKTDQNTYLSKHEFLSVDEEASYLNILNKYLDNEIVDDPTLMRFRAKLTLRNLKRKNYSKVFDIDSYVNELIDQEKMKMLNSIKQRKLKLEFAENCQNDVTESDDDIIFESASLQATDNSEIIEIKRVLDRFKNRKQRDHNHEIDLDVHMVEARKEDTKCLISPYSNQVLKPFIWKDHRSLPKKLRLHKNLLERLGLKFDRFSIDYVHLRPEHVMPINAMCRQHFWTGIDISECLGYPDYTIVALYRKLIVGFALLVPNSSLKEAYLSFILVHPDWRSDNALANHSDVNFKYTFKCSDCDLTLHVSGIPRYVINFRWSLVNIRWPRETYDFTHHKMVFGLYTLLEAGLLFVNAQTHFLTSETKPNSTKLWRSTICFQSDNDSYSLCSDGDEISLDILQYRQNLDLMRQAFKIA